MNNSLLKIENVPLTMDSTVDRSEMLKEREGKLLRIIEALRSVQGTKSWGVLQELVFDGLTDTLTKEINTEARQDNPDSLKLSRLAGQLKWAEKFSDLSKLENVFRIDLTNIRKAYGKT